MMCENKFCLYWDNNTCVLNEVSLDIQGSCTNCIYISFEEAELNERRHSQLEEA